MIGAIIAKRRVRAAYQRLNQRDLDAFLADWAENATFDYPGDVPGVSGKMEGKQAIERWFRNFMDQFPKINFSLKHVCVENPLAFGGTNVVSVEWALVLANKAGENIEDTGVTAIELEGGRAIAVRDHIDRANTDSFRRGWGA